MSEFAQLAGGVIVGGFDGSDLPREIRARLEAGHLAGVTLFKRNLADMEQTAALCDALCKASASGAPPVIAIDQEGGRVARLREPVVKLPPMRAFGALDDPAFTQQAARVLASQLAALGINLDCAPVADVDSNPNNPIIGDRSFGPTADLVGRHVTAVVRGLREGGVLGCAKHFPGHGDTETDSHLELPRVRHDRARLERLEFPPFRAAVEAGVASFMTAHVVFDALDPGVPATMSHAIVTDLLRTQLQFNGVCFSDDLHMKAVADRWSIEESSVAAIEAGCDALLICTDPESQDRAHEALARRSERDPRFLARIREANHRMLAMRRACPPRPEQAPSTLRARLESDAVRALERALVARGLAS